MRPIRLVMSAFGSYGKEVEIDFSNLNGKLFLITGDTGAGKTTIFDAIMFALYGRTSGGERNGSMMRSQFASADAKTCVRYRFAYGTEVYEIVRNPEYNIQVTLKNGNVKTRKVAQNVELILPDGSVFPGKKAETDAKIEELTGLSGEQFTQMAMIAQGDFLKLIYAKTDERKKIFTRLFGTGIYTKIEEELRRRSGQMDDEIQENRRAIEQEYARRMLPEGFEETEAETPLRVLEQYLLYGREQEREIKKEYTLRKHELESLQEKITKAGVTERMFLSLETAVKKQERLREQKEEMEQVRNKLRGAKQADLVLQAEQRFKETEKMLEKNRREQKAMEDLNVQLSEDMRLFEEVRRWNGLLSKADQCRQISARLKACGRQQEELLQKQKNWQQITEESIVLSREYDEKYLIFLREQAGILAESLEEHMPCPVCGSTEHPNPAKLSGEAVSEQEVNQARAKREKAEKQRQEAEQEYRLKEEQQKGEWRNLTEQLESFLSRKILNPQQAEEAVKAAYAQSSSEIADSRKLFADRGRWKEYSLRCERQMGSVREENRQKFYAEILKEAEQLYQDMLSEYGRKQGEQETRKALEQELVEKQKQEKKQFEKAVREAGFSDEEAYHKNILSQKGQKRLEEQISDYEAQCQKNAGEIQTLKEQLRGKKRIPVEEAEISRRALEGKLRLIEQKKQMLHTANTTNALLRENLKAYEEEGMRLREEDAVIKSLFRTANGRLTQSAKMDFETYVQRQYFRQIIRQANRRFLVMTNQQFMLQIKEEMTGKGKNEGLDLLVYSLVTGSLRDVKTLSGGESFLAALSMALGLSDIVKQNAGGIRLDMMFIDEGFGSLDGESRKKAIEVLDELSDGQRMIGIISHVTELKEQLDRKLIVTRNEKGSSICWENS